MHETRGLLKWFVISFYLKLKAPICIPPFTINELFVVWGCSSSRCCMCVRGPSKKDRDSRFTESFCLKGFCGHWFVPTRLQAMLQINHGSEQATYNNSPPKYITHCTRNDSIDIHIILTNIPRDPLLFMVSCFGWAVSLRGYSSSFCAFISTLSLFSHQSE